MTLPDSINPWLQFVVFIILIVGGLYSLGRWMKKPIMGEITKLREEVQRDFSAVKADANGLGGNIHRLDTRVAATERIVDTIQGDHRHDADERSSMTVQLGRIEELARGAIAMSARHRDEIMQMINANMMAEADRNAKMRERLARLEERQQIGHVE